MGQSGGNQLQGPKGAAPQSPTGCISFFQAKVVMDVWWHLLDDIRDLMSRGFIGGYSQVPSCLEGAKILLEDRFSA